MSYLKNPVDRQLVEPSVRDMLRSAEGDAAVNVLRKCHDIGGRKAYADGGVVGNDQGNMPQAQMPISNLPYPAAGN